MTERRPPSEESEFGGERFAMREVRAVESDEAPELPRRTWVAFAAILAVVAVVAVGFWWVRVGFNAPPSPEEIRQFKADLAQTDMGRQGMFRDARFENGTTAILQLDLSIKISDAESRGVLRTATREAVEVFHRMRPHAGVTVYGYQGTRLVTSGEYRLHPDTLTRDKKPQYYFVEVEGGGELGPQGPATGSPSGG